jgi:hypothetical protein
MTIRKVFELLPPLNAFQHNVAEYSQSKSDEHAA